MATYELTSPDGSSTYQVDAPDDANPADIMNFAAQHHAEQQANADENPKTTKGQSLTDHVMNNATFGLYPAANALGGMAADKVKQFFGAAPSGNTYNDYVQEGKDTLNQEDAEHPYMSGAGSITGLVAGGPGGALKDILASKAAQKAGQAIAPQIIPTLAKQGMQNAAVSGGIGAVTGFANTDGDLKDKAAGAATNAAIMAPVGFAMPYAVKGGADIVGGIGNAIGAFTKEGQQKLAGQVLNEAAQNGPIAAQASPLPGMNLTTGQATNDPGLMWLERSLQQKDQNGAAASMQAATGNNGAIIQGIKGVGDTSLAPEAPSTIAQGLDAAKAANKQIVSATWKQAGLDESIPMPTQPLKDNVNNFIGNLAKADRTQIPAEITQDFDNLDKNEPLSEIQAIRSKLGGMASEASRAGNPQKARILGGLNDVVTQHAETPELAGLSGEQAEAYQQARAETANFKQNFEQPPDIRKIFGKDSYGADKLPESATADQFIKSGKGGPEAIMSYFNAIRQAPPDVQSKANDAMRGYFAQKMLDETGLSKLDLNDKNVISAAKVQDFTDKYQHVLNSPLFTDSQRQLVKDVQNAANMSNRTAMAGAPGGSDTFAKISGDKFIDAVLGKYGSKAIKGASMVAGAVGGGHVGGPVGAVVAGAEAGHLANKLFEAPKAKTMAILQEAMRDPQLARDLQMKASAANEKFISPKLALMLGLKTGQTAVGFKNAVNKN